MSLEKKASPVVSPITMLTDRRGTSNRFFELYDKMVGEISLPETLREVAKVASEDFNAQRATIYVIDEQTQELRSMAVVGNIIRAFEIPINSKSLAGYCAFSGKSFIVNDAYGDLSHIDADLQFDSTWDEINNFRTRDVMCCPVTFKGKVTGVVQLVNSMGTAFSEANLPAMRDVSRLIGYALYHARLCDDLATMKQLDVEKAQFMRVMIHELKSPVSAAKMLADILRAEPDLTDDVSHLTGRITDRLDQLGTLVMDILELAQVKSGKPLGEVGVLDISTATKECCDDLASLAASKGLEMDVSIQAESACVRIDHQGYQLIVSNLVGNAIKYTSSGKVSVSLQLQSPWAILEVADTGMGIPKSDIPKMFGEFFRAGNAKNSNVSGSGVGLAGVKNIVERFRGQIEFQSRQNEGSTFTVRLPIFVETPEIQPDTL